MAQKQKAVKYKVIAGYLLLFTVAVVSVWFVYTEILKIAVPGQTEEDNKQIIRISNTIADLYASEAVGRSSILTGTAKDYNAYSRLIDSIHKEIEGIKEEVEHSQRPKFDSIQFLLNRKKNSINEIIQYRNNFNKNNTFRRAISGIYNVKDSIKSTVQPIRSEKKYQWNNLVNALLTPAQLDSLSKLPVSNDSLAMAFDKVLTDLLVKENRLRYRLFRKEQLLLEENRIISDQLRVILASVENDFLQNSYAKINKSQASISNTIKTMAWVGAITFFFLIIFAWIIIRDLTSNQNYRKQLELLNVENEELLRSKSMLMATVTHDLQTPLGSIIGFHDLLKESGVNAKQRQYLDNIKESAGYIMKLVNDLLDFSKLENNRITIEKAPFNIKQLVENTCKTLEPIAVNKDIELNWDIDEDLNATFLSDRYRIKQVLTNLVSNAIKFTNEGSVEVTGRLYDGNIMISVLDTGIGIAPDKHGEVFKEFTQAHSGIEKKFGGTGLGLNISKRILELLEGEVQLESVEGQGSIFTIILPAIKADEVAVAGRQPFEDVTNYLKGKKILMVDDDAVQLMLMRELFANYPADVTTEINSSLIITMLEKQRYDLLISDVQMPVLDGFGLISLIRHHDNPQIAALPVIALSGKRDLVPSDFTEKGFTAHHPKPIQLETLINLIAGIFGYAEMQGREEVVATKPDNSGPLYNLQSLTGFTNNDPESLKTILRTFIDTVHANCRELTEAASAKDAHKMAETAHRMIPMLRQMEIHSIADLLLPIEERTLRMGWPEIIEYANGICERMDKLVKELYSEID